MRIIPAIILTLAVGCAVTVEAATVETKKTDQTVEVLIDGKPFTTLNYGDDLPKPFFAPVRGPSGDVMTRPIFFNGEIPERFRAQTPKVEGKIDHPHQKGLFLAVDEINGIEFWAEDGKIETKSVEVTEKDGSATIKLINHWLDPNGQTVLIEKTSIDIHPNRLMEWDIRFTAGVKDVTFDDTKEGMFGIRLIGPLRELEHGKVVSSEGAEGTAEAWGKTADWVDYHGPLEHGTVGVALFDHPDNFRKSRFHVRNYGLFTMNPFGESAYTKGAKPAKPVHLDPGKTLRLRYGVYVHAGDAKQGHVAEAFQQFAK